jgi:hypothetical protein
MKKLIELSSPQELLTEQFPAIAISLLVTENFFILHSFTLECLVFLGGWYIMNLLIVKAKSFLKSR